MKKQEKTDKWQEGSADKKDFKGDKKQRGTEEKLCWEGRRSPVPPSRGSGRTSAHQVFPPSIWGQVRDMKRPQDYSSPDSDTDEFIDVGQEDSFWWASWRKLQLFGGKNHSKHIQGQLNEAFYTKMNPSPVVKPAFSAFKLVELKCRSNWF